MNTSIYICPASSIPKSTGPEMPKNKSFTGFTGISASSVNGTHSIFSVWSNAADQDQSADAPQLIRRDIDDKEEVLSTIVLSVLFYGSAPAAASPQIPASLQHPEGPFFQEPPFGEYLFRDPSHAVCCAS